jgi:hypothetical protein
VVLGSRGWNSVIVVAARRGVPVIAGVFLDIVTWICDCETCVANNRVGICRYVYSACSVRVATFSWINSRSLSQHFILQTFLMHSVSRFD